jgi:hypothetical protein
MSNTLRVKELIKEQERGSGLLELKNAFLKLTDQTKDRIWQLKLTESQSSLESIEERREGSDSFAGGIGSGGSPIKMLDDSGRPMNLSPIEQYGRRFQEVRTLKLDKANEEEEEKEKTFSSRKSSEAMLKQRLEENKKKRKEMDERLLKFYQQRYKREKLPG